MNLSGLIRDIPDFPEPGIVFKDITPLLLDPEACRSVTSKMCAFAEPLGVDVVVAAEARGFIFGGALAQALGAGFVPARKPGQLPAETISVEYELEYGIDALEVHADAFAAGSRVLIHDDLLATGGTAAATIKAVEHLGGEVVGCAFVIELGFLPGRERLASYPVDSLVSFD
ncbi:MAG: adenine phosphoribosyltransferase [Solirubrobacterales bacterium]